jgi:hypothetical protein
MTQPRRYRYSGPTPCDVITLWVLATCAGYVSVLVATVIRHMATGAW